MTQQTEYEGNRNRILYHECSEYQLAILSRHGRTETIRRRAELELKDRESLRKEASTK